MHGLARASHAARGGLGIIALVTCAACGPQLTARGEAPCVPAGCRAKDEAAEPYSGTGWARTIVHEATGLELAFIPAGTFTMGSPPAEKARTDDEVPHDVELTKPFFIGVHEVTQAQWEKLMGNSPAHFKGDDRRPVECVSWNDCQEFLRKAGGDLRLPTEAEWEYASRAGSTKRFCFGDDEAVLPDYAWFNAVGTSPVGTKKANAWGLHDMHGNVYEWCADRFGPYPADKVTDLSGPAAGDLRALRGGCYRYSPRKCRSAYRGGGPVDRGFNNLGFRVALTVQP
jgi:formylglycine-generating enzyme required for sulfatase activity